MISAAGIAARVSQRHPCRRCRSASRTSVPPICPGKTYASGTVEGDRCVIDHIAHNAADHVPPLPICSVPPEIVVPPEKLLLVPRISVPVPLFVRLPRPADPATGLRAAGNRQRPCPCQDSPCQLLKSRDRGRVAPLRLAVPPVMEEIDARPRHRDGAPQRPPQDSPTAAKVVTPVPPRQCQR